MKRLWNWFLAPGVFWLVVFFIVPTVILVGVSFGTSDIVNRPVLGWHPENYLDALDPLYVRLLGRALLYAGATAAICLLVGYPVAYTVARFGGRYKNILIGLVILPWLVDYLVRVYAWVVILGNEGLLNSLLGLLGASGDPPLQMTNTGIAVVIGLVYGYFPLMVLPVYANLLGLDPALIEAGKDLYGTPKSTFLHVTLPASMPGIFGGCMLVFLPAVGDFATAKFLGGPENYMIGNLIADQFQQSGDWPFGAAVTVVMMAVMWSVILVYLVYTLMRGRESAAKRQSR